MSELERLLVTIWPKLHLATLSGETEAQPPKHMVAVMGWNWGWVLSEAQLVFLLWLHLEICQQSHEL